MLTVGLGKILQLLTSGDIDAQIRAVKVVANLAAEGTYRVHFFATVCAKSLPFSMSGVVSQLTLCMPIYRTYIGCWLSEFY